LRSLTIEFMVRKLHLSAAMQIHDLPAAWLHRSYKAEYDSESVSGIQSYEITMPNAMPTQPRRSRHCRCYCKNQLPNQHRMKPDDELIWDRKTPYEISCRRSNDFQKEGNDRTGLRTTLPQTITVPDVQERSTAKRID
jgi:hypothetical protein